MNVSKEEFLDWKTQQVTKEVFQVIIDRITDTKDMLASNAGLDSLNDRYLVGMIHAFREVLAVDWED